MALNNFAKGNERDRLKFMVEGGYRPKFLERLKWGLYDLADRAVKNIADSPNDQIRFLVYFYRSLFGIHSLTDRRP